MIALVACVFTTEAQFTCTTSNGEVTITGYTCPEMDMALTIPNQIDGLPVVRIMS